MGGIASLAVPLLAEGLKGWLEDPAFLIGVPLLAIGALGVMVMLIPFRAYPRIEAYQAEDVSEAYYDEGHPGPEVYVRVGIALAVITAIEVAVVYIELVAGIFIGVLLALSLLKFVLVVLWFMHLRFDNRLFSTLFWGGLALAVAIFMVVLATLGANLL
jgi:cytochrome c oxidase subunit 4